MPEKKVLIKDILNIDDFMGFDAEDEVDADFALEEKMDQWEHDAIQAIREQRIIERSPMHGTFELDVDGILYIWNNDEGLHLKRKDVPVKKELNKAARKGNPIFPDNGKDIPFIVKGEFKRPAPLRRAPAFKAPKIHDYPKFGVRYNGYLFSRNLSLEEKMFLANFGYHDLLKKTPDLFYKDKDVPIDENEECVILLSELADHLAIQSCKMVIPNFSIDTHSTEYQVVYKRYLKEISAFKRVTNG